MTKSIFEEFVTSEECENIEDINNMMVKYLQQNTFNNLEVILKKKEVLSLDLEDLAKKIYLKKMGGYCFEHNKLFYSFLTSKGFAVSSHLGRVVYGKKIDVPKTHRITLLTDRSEKYLVDVGFGAYGPNMLIPLNGSVVYSSNGNSYRVVKSGEGLYSFEMFRDGEFFTLYTFDEYKYTEADFESANFYSSTHPNSKHVNSLVISQLTEKGAEFINDSIYTNIDGEVRTNLQINSHKHLNKMLIESFNLVLENDDLLKIFNFIKEKEGK